MQNALNHNCIVPLYAQIVEQLKQDIESGVYSKDGRLPTEAELSAEYGVSRITIRRASWSIRVWWRNGRERGPLSVRPS